MKRAVVLVLVLALAASALIAVAVVVWNPIRMEVSFLPDGGYSIHGGTNVGELLRYLQEGPQPPNQPAYFAVRSPYQTLALEADTFRLPQAPTEIPSIGGIPWNASLGLFLHEFQREVASLAGWILGFFVMDARAVNCNIGGGACFWVGGTGNFSDGTHWSNSTGGANCGCTPTSTSTVTFDASSGAGTATQNVAPFTSAAVTMTNSSVTVSGSSNTWNVGGNWNDNTSSAKFSASTSTVVFTATATLTAVGGESFYNLTVNASVVLSVGNYTFITHNLTVNGTYTATGTAHSNDMIIFGNVTITIGGSGVTNFGVRIDNGWTVSIPASTYYWLQASPSANASLAGAVVLSSYLTFGADNTSVMANGGTITTNGFSLTGTAGELFVRNAGQPAIVNAGASQVQVGSVKVDNATNYITSTAGGSWTVSGAWTNSSTSASWSFAAPITFTSTGNQTMTFANVTQEFGGNVTFAPTAGTPTYTMAGFALKVGGYLLFNPTGGGVLDVSASNLGITVAGTLFVTGGAASGLVSRAATVSIGGESTNSTYDYITSTAGGSWTVSGAWANSSTSGSWSFAAPITFKSPANQSMFFDTSVTEFSGAVTFDTTTAAGVTYTLAHAANFAGGVTIQNTAGGASGPVILDTSAANLAVTSAGFAVAALGQIVAHSSILTANGNVTGLGSISGGTLVFNASVSWSLPTVGAVTVNAFTVTLGANVASTSSTINTGGTLALSGKTFGFTYLMVNGSLQGTATAKRFSIIPTSGVFTILSWSQYDTTNNGIAFNGSDSVPGDSVRFTFSEIPANLSVQALVDGVVVSTSSALGTGGFVTTLSSWLATHAIALYWGNPGGWAKVDYATDFSAAQVFDWNLQMKATVRFTFTGPAPSDSPPTSFKWDFGDGTSGTGNPIEHTYDIGGPSGGASVLLLACSQDHCGVAQKSIAFYAWGLLMGLGFITLMLIASTVIALRIGRRFYYGR